MQFILCQCNGFSGPLLDSLHSWYPPWRHQHQQPVYPLSVCIMSALGTFHPPRVSSARSPHTEDWSEARVCSGLVTYSDIQPVSAVSGSHSRVVTRLMRVVSMYVLNCSASTTIFTVNGSHRNTSYSDAVWKAYSLLMLRSINMLMLRHPAAAVCWNAITIFVLSPRLVKCSAVHKHAVHWQVLTTHWGLRHPTMVQTCNCLEKIFDFTFVLLSFGHCL